MAEDRFPTRGMTLIEALVVLAVLAIAMAVAIPNMRAYSVRNKFLTPVRDAEKVLSVARLQAVNAQRPVVVAFMKSGAVWDEWPAEPFTGKNCVVAFLDNDGNGSFTSGDVIAGTFVFPPAVSYRRPAAAEPLPTARVTYSPGGALTTGGNVDVYLGDNLENFIRLTIRGATGHVQRQMYNAETVSWIGQADEAKWPWRY